MMVLTFNALNEQGPSYIADFFRLYKVTQIKMQHVISPCTWSQYLNKQTVIELWGVDHLELSSQRVEDNEIVYFVLKTFELTYLILFDNYVVLYG